MELLGVRVELPANTPVVMLREHDVQPARVLPILIGGPEASSIHSAMEGIMPPRPLTHDLAITLLATLGATLEHVVVTEVREHTFYANLHLRTAAGAALWSPAAPAMPSRWRCARNAPIFAEEACSTRLPWRHRRRLPRATKKRSSTSSATSSTTSAPTTSPAEPFSRVPRDSSREECLTARASLPYDGKPVTHGVVTRMSSPQPHGSVQEGRSDE
jgi:bifunctional DNase/RNase